MSSNGITQQYVSPLPVGSSGSIYDSGIIRQSANTHKLNALINVGGNNTIRVPPVRALYPESGANGQTVSGNTVGITTLGTTNVANSKYDGCVGMSAAACSAQSGGKKSTKRRHRKAKKTRKKIKKIKKKKTKNSKKNLECYYYF
jgi:hypothetical protein